MLYVADAGKLDRIGVIRDAFTPFNAAEAELGKTVAALSEGQAAVNSAAAFAPQGIVIDEYVRDDESQAFRLTHIATDLLRSGRVRHDGRMVSRLLKLILHVHSGVAIIIQ